MYVLIVALRISLFYKEDADTAELVIVPQIEYNKRPVIACFMNIFIMEVSY
tara:strand:+ start:8137 stop:8289 length:153 start_codon:yes stop_codon:yes gene_type:complete